MNFSWNVSESTRRRNPHLFGLGSVPPAKPKRSGRRKPQTQNENQTRSAFRLVVSIIGFRRIPLDDDNFISACKHTRDAIAASLTLDDGDKRLRWQYQQIQTAGTEGLMVRIEIA